MLPIQMQILTAWLAVRDRLLDAVDHARSDERGELTGNLNRSLDPY